VKDALENKEKMGGKYRSGEKSRMKTN